MSGTEAGAMGAVSPPPDLDKLREELEVLAVTRPFQGSTPDWKKRACYEYGVRIVHKEIARLLQISVSTVRRYVPTGEGWVFKEPPSGPFPELEELRPTLERLCTEFPARRAAHGGVPTWKRMLCLEFGHLDREVLATKLGITERQVEYAQELWRPPKTASEEAVGPVST